MVALTRTSDGFARAATRVATLRAIPRSSPSDALELTGVDARPNPQPERSEADHQGEGAARRTLGRAVERREHAVASRADLLAAEGGELVASSPARVRDQLVPRTVPDSLGDAGRSDDVRHEDRLELARSDGAAPARLQRASPRTR